MDHLPRLKKECDHTDFDTTWALKEIERLRRIEDAARNLSGLCPWKSITYVRVNIDFKNALEKNPRPTTETPTSE